MKRILLLSGIFTLLTTTGCLVSDGERHGYYHEHERFERRPEVVVEPPPVVVRAPLIEVRPPEIIVR